jgi:hypothetical protein
MAISLRLSFRWCRAALAREIAERAALRVVPMLQRRCGFGEWTEVQVAGQFP